MAKIPFDIKYRPQIESGEYKVETRDGRPARIICWDARADDGACIIALIPGYGGEEAYQFFPNGKAFSSKSSVEDCADLFIITPEPELSEFEKEYIRLYNEGYADGQAGSKPISNDNLKEYAAELFELAKKEIGTTFDKAGEYLRGRNYGIEYGKAEALKGLPRWKKCAPCDKDDATIPAWIVRFDAELAGESAVVHNGHYILFGDLEKLPKEEQQ